MNYLKELEKKYGSWKETDKYIYNCPLTKYSAKTVLNAIYTTPCKKENIKALKLNGVHVGKSLSDFYSVYNGLTLFSHSFVIFGYQKTMEYGYSPLDSETMNRNNLIKNKRWDTSFYSIGNYSNYEICVKKHQLREIYYIVDFNSSTVIKTFNTIDDVIEYVTIKLNELYDANGMKKNKPSGVDTPLKNMSFEDIFK